MNPIRFPRQVHPLLFTVLAGAALFCPLPPAIAAPADTGSLSGKVANSATHVFLQGAVVSIPALSRQALTDEFGQYTFLDVPPGDYPVNVSYIGLDTQQLTAHVVAGERANLDFTLTAEVYKMGALEVTGIREGAARAITEQRTAPNLINEVALDSLGNLPNESAGEMLIRMPGVSANLDAENNVQGVQIRGVPDNLVFVTVDGNAEASPGGVGRVFQTHSISGALFEDVGVVKAPTPDMSADSIGGIVVLKTRDPLSIQGDSEISYRAADRWAAPFFAETPYRRQHAMQPLLSAGYEGVFDVLGGHRNLGVSFNAFYSENATGYNESGNNLYQQSLAEPTYMYQYQTVDGYNNRKQTSADLKLEYRLSDHMTISLNTLYNDAFEPYNPIYTMTAATGQSVGPDIAPGYNDNVTQVLPAAASKVTLNSLEYSFIDRQREVQLNFKNDFDRLHLEYGVNYNQAHPNLGNGKANGNQTGGIFTYSVPSVGWLVDTTHSPIYPQFTQTAGPSIYNGANYGSGLMISRATHRYTEIQNANFDADYDLPTSFTSSIKAGWRYQATRWTNAGNQREWNYVGSSLATLVDPTIVTFDEARTGMSLPFITASRAATDIQTNPQNWTENLYYHTMYQYQNSNEVYERINAAYIQANAKLGNLDILSGVRMENTDEYGQGFVRAATLSTAAQQAANPVGSALADYDNPVSTQGGYTNYFPGVYLTYHITHSLQARADYSNGIGRPTEADVVPALTPNTTADTLTIANPSVKPQYARNLDADLEYYFEPVGEFSFGWFRKDIKDYITSASNGFVGQGVNNGYGGDYAGYQILTNLNLGSAVIEGWELAYQQRFSFLPGALKGLGFFANYTQLITHGNYGGGTVLGSNQVAAFVPKTGNLGFNYNYNRFGARLLVNYTGRYLNTTSTNAAVLLFRYARTVANLGFNYDITRAYSLSVDFTNLFNEPQGEYYGTPTRRGLTIYDYSSVTFAVSGKF